jgi:hypothetical protein
MSKWETLFTRELDEMIYHYLNTDVAAGELESVTLTPEFAAEHGISQIATVTYDEDDDKTTYHAGPREFPLMKNPFPEIKIESMVPFMEAYRDGTTLPKLSEIVSKGVEIKQKEANVSIVQSSYLESYIFRLKPNIMLINPSKGSIYRAEEENRNVYVHMTSSDPKWADMLKTEFKPRFRAKKLIFKIVGYEVELTDHLVYHGSNGFTHVKLMNSYALEPNPYSSTLRLEGGCVVQNADSVKYTYYRKERKLQYIFAKTPHYYRVDPNTMASLGMVRGDSYFLASTVNPAHFDIPLRKTKAS